VEPSTLLLNYIRPLYPCNWWDICTVGGAEWMVCA
jgi:hypothetical protein